MIINYGYAFVSLNQLSLLIHVGHVMTVNATDINTSTLLILVASNVEKAFAPSFGKNSLLLLSKQKILHLRLVV